MTGRVCLQLVTRQLHSGRLCSCNPACYGMATLCLFLRLQCMPVPHRQPPPLPAPPHPSPTRSYYPLIVLPELLQQLISLWPALLHKIGFAEGYKLRGWRTATWSWVARAFPHPDDSATGAPRADEEKGQAPPAGKPAAAAAAVDATCIASDCPGYRDGDLIEADLKEASTPSPNSSAC